MHPVIHQPRMAAQRDALARGSKISFGGDGVLLIGKLIAHIGQHFYQGYADIGGVAAEPIRYQHAHAVQHQATEAGVILGKIIEARIRRRRRRTRGNAGAIEIRFALHLE
ncbi:MAG: hypothetical protein ABL862_02155 [Candidatus Nitrotoga sp.]